MSHAIAVLTVGRIVVPPGMRQVAHWVGVAQIHPMMKVYQCDTVLFPNCLKLASTVAAASARGKDSSVREDAAGEIDYGLMPRQIECIRDHYQTKYN
jgi:hypothetical protein